MEILPYGVFGREQNRSKPNIQAIFAASEKRKRARVKKFPAADGLLKERSHDYRNVVILDAPREQSKNYLASPQLACVMLWFRRLV